MRDCLVSVVMPVYNGEKYLEEAVESILAQSLPDFELIIINDGSTDKSLEILESLYKKDSRIKLLNNVRNRGIVDCLNKGIKQARGKYIARMDADDIAIKERLERQLKFLENNPEYVAVGCRVLAIDAEGLPIKPFGDCFTHEEIDKGNLRGVGSMIIHPAAVIRRESLEKVGGYRHYSHAEDLDLFLRLAEIGKLANLPEILLKYRLHVDSIGGKYRHIQLGGCRKAVLDACRRRGITVAGDFGVTIPQKPVSRGEIYRKWGWWSLQGGNIKTCRKYALKALIENPLHLDNWRLFWCCLRGY
ncbi:MAG: glycosyltransferase [Geminocystis sp.]|nr:glycosyltransferase [Geminocystis sp.]HIK38766.1 glycosyltransferase [Geminocystis sp. M7585_C2015_104]MCS7147885.1 glycosyltransferase [Geminocystis sp.]MCX8078711.1 glycosyltransferase [Geminocystis sp.]MDW8117027.1 glycosyltransferase [Geminocystis sp.]